MNENGNAKCEALTADEELRVKALRRPEVEKIRKAYFPEMTMHGVYAQTKGYRTLQPEVAQVLKRYLQALVKKEEAEREIMAEVLPE